MCYDIKVKYEIQLKRAERKGDQKIIDEIKERLLPLTDLPLHHVSGFSHPKVLIYTSENNYYPKIAVWGLIPDWIGDVHKAKQIQNKTLNARVETIFEKPSFKNSAIDKRCLLFIDGFYEYHYYAKKSYPYYIFNKTNSPIALACLWSEWVNVESAEIETSFAIVTTKANSFMAKIHNNPKLDEARMPLMIPKDLENQWLDDIDTEHKLNGFLKEINNVDNFQLSAHTVGKLRGKNYVGNVESVTKPHIYRELRFDNDDSNEKELTLF